MKTEPANTRANTSNQTKSYSFRFRFLYQNLHTHTHINKRPSHTHHVYTLFEMQQHIHSMYVNNERIFVFMCLFDFPISHTLDAGYACRRADTNASFLKCDTYIATRQDSHTFHPPHTHTHDRDKTKLCISEIVLDAYI